jgi:hypothetical protein
MSKRFHVAIVALLGLLGIASTAPAAPVEKVDSFAAPGAASQMVYSAQYGLLFMRNSASAIRVVDTNAKQQIDLHLATERFTDIDLSPDGRYLFAADYGGERTGYGDPIRPSYVHRYDLATRTWDSPRRAPKIAYRIEAVDAGRFINLDSDQWVDLTLNRWNADGTTITEVLRRGSDFYGDIEYDPTTGRIFHGNSGLSSQEIHAYRLVEESIVNAEASGTYGSAQGHGGTVVLSTDGERVYYGRLQVEALDVTHNVRVFPERIYAANRDVAFGPNAYYDADSGENLGALGYASTVFAIDTGGAGMVVYDATGNMLHRYALVPEPGVLGGSAVVVVAAAGLLGRRRPRLPRP